MIAEQDAAPDAEEYRAISEKAVRIHLPDRRAGELPYFPVANISHGIS
jgi:hypothetical protein